MKAAAKKYRDIQFAVGSIFDSPVDVYKRQIQEWLKAGADGWRLDVADELPDLFLEHIAKAAKQIKPTAMILGEVWEDASNKMAYGQRRRYLLGKQLDSVMNYPCLLYTSRCV